VSGSNAARRTEAGHGFINDDSLWPLVATIIPASAFDDEVRAHMAYIDALYARREPFLSITFVRLSRGITAEQRMAMNDWMRATRPQMEAFNRGAMMVSSSTMFRLVLAGMMLVSPMAVPYVVVPRAPDGAEWLRERAHQSGLELPSNLVTGLERLQSLFEP